MTKDFLDLLIMLSNILNPHIFGDYVSNNFMDEFLLSQVNGSVLFPEGPIELEQCFDRTKKLYYSNQPLNHEEIIQTFVLAA
jgi:hypothetical protein